MKHLVVLFLALNSAAVADETGFRAWMETRLSDHTLTVVPNVEVARHATLRYELISSKTGKSGVSNTRQSGSFSASQNQPTPLSTLNLGIGPTDRYTITLKLYENDELVAEDTIKYP